METEYVGCHTVQNFGNGSALFESRKLIKKGW